MNKRDILQQWYDRVWTLGDLSAIDQMFSPVARAEGLVPDMQIGPDEFKVLVTAVLELVNPPRAMIEKTVEQGDWLAALVTVETTAIDQNRPIKTGGMVFTRFEGDKIVEAYNSFDFLGFFEQLGLLPENALALCLSGERLG